MAISGIARSVRHAAASRCADLICVGAQKAGTTWLHRTLLDHPAITAPVFKEVHYFDSLHVPVHHDFHARRTRRSRQILADKIEPTLAHRMATFLLTRVLDHRTARRYVAEHRFAASMDPAAISDAWYASLFQRARPDQIACDFTPAYALLPDSGIAHLRRLCPDAHVVYLLRHPVDRALSHARMLIVRNRRERSVEQLLQFLDSPLVTGHDDCLSIIDRWTAALPSGRFKVLFFDDIAECPERLLEEICVTVGIDYRKSHFKRVTNVIYRGPQIPVPDKLRYMLHDRYHDVLAGLRRRYPDRTAHWLAP